MLKDGKSTLPTLSDLDFQKIKGVLYDLSGIELDLSQKIMVQSRLGSELWRLGYNDWAQFISDIKYKKSPNLTQSFINLLTTNKTHFFREKKHFEYITGVFLQNFIKTSKRKLTVWSAATSMGHEAYSLLMTLNDCRDQLQGSFDYRILATDIDTQVLEVAQKGIYPLPELKKSLSPTQLSKYWHQGVGKNIGLARIKQEFLKNMKFRHLNLNQNTWDIPLQFDIIMIRNVLIYFDKRSIDQIINKMSLLLNPNGLLIFGYSEGVPVNIDGFNYLGTSIYQKENDAHRKENVPYKKKSPVRVAIIDDSPTIQKLLHKIFSDDPRFEVVGQFSNPVDAIDGLRDVKADVLTLDIDMPKMSGIEFLFGPWNLLKIPVIMVTSHSTTEGGKAIQALDLGAFDCITKPKFDDLKEVSDRILETTWVASQSTVITKKNLPEVSPTAVLTDAECDHSLIAIGSSTGGTIALQNLLAGFSKPFPPLLIAQHIPAHFSKAFADHLDSKFPFQIKEAQSGERLKKSTVYIAPGGQQMTLGPGLCIILSENTGNLLHSPSVDLLFDSLLPYTKKMKIVAALLTGMGQDGAQGLLNLKNKGVFTVAQDKQTSVVFGMPRVAIQMGAAHKVLPLNKISKELICAIRNSPHGRLKDFAEK